MNTVQQTLLSRMSALEVIERKKSVPNAVFTKSLPAVDKRQTMIEDNHSTIEFEKNSEVNSLFSIQ
jgi:hypothetical protein